MVLISVRSILLTVLINATFLLCLVRAKTKITILHVNDMHARFEETNENSGKCTPFEDKYGFCFGGFPRLSSALKMFKKQAESEGRIVLVLNGGDIFQGSLYYNFFKGEVCSKLVPFLNFDASAVGNHEFDDGPGNLGEFLNNVSVPFVSANLDVSKEPALSKIKKSLLVTRGDLSIGIVGYITPDTKRTSKPGKVVFLPEIPSIREEIKELRKKGAKIVIALGHSGFEKDKQIAKEVDGVDVVVGAHSNTFLHNGKPPSIEIPSGPYPYIVERNRKKIPIVMAYAYTKYLGVLNFDYEDGQITDISGNSVILDKSIPEDEEVVKALEVWKEKVDAFANEEVGLTKVFLDGSSILQRQESNLANLITDAYIDYYMKKHVNTGYNKSGWTDAPIAIVQGGGIRASINASASDGVITFGDVALVLPFMDPLCKVTIRGDFLRNAFEWSVTTYEYGGGNFEGGFLHVSGILVHYDISKFIGSRVVSLKARCGQCVVPHYENVRDDAYYTVLMSQYLANGGDGFDIFKNNGTKTLLDEIDTHIVVEYIKKKSPIYPGVEGRITVRSSAEHLFAISMFYLCLRTVLIYVLL